MKTDIAQTTSIAISNGDKRMIIGFDLHAWETAMVVSLIFAGIIAIAVAVSTWAVVTLTRESVVESNVKIADSNKRAAEAMLELEKLRKETSPRRITQEQQTRISEKLSEFKGQLVSLGVNPSTNENEWLVRHIGAAFSMAGWTVEMKTGDAAKNRFIPDGVLVQSTSHPRSIVAAKKVADALNAEGLDALTAPILDTGLPINSDATDPHSFRLLVVIGDKPIFKPSKTP